MKKIIAGMLFLLPLVLCAQDKATNTNKDKWMKKQEINYLALGDSYTIGESVKISERYPMQLAASLNKMGYDVNEPEIIAKTGWTTDELMTALKNKEVKSDYDMVTLLIGVNNQYRGRALEEFRLQFAELLEMAIKYAAGKPDHVMVLSIPDWSVVPFAKDRKQKKISREIAAFNTVKKEETLKRNVSFTDITPISKKAKENLNYVAGDDLHFSGKMHQLWVDEIIRTNF